VEVKSMLSKTKMDVLSDPKEFGCQIKVIINFIEDMQGLAMSRSFGDNVSKPIGVTHVPEIINLKIDKRDRFILIASDGVWEFISNQ
jgi:serine/threonine protein phosphatase PrpC